jgi:hypothetical protein
MPCCGHPGGFLGLGQTARPARAGWAFMCNARACDAPGMIPTLSDGSHPNFTISEMALRILAYNLTRVMNIMASKPLLARISAETAAPTPRTATLALAPTQLRHRAEKRAPPLTRP